MLINDLAVCGSQNTFNTFAVDTLADQIVIVAKGGERFLLFVLVGLSDGWVSNERLTDGDSSMERLFFNIRLSFCNLVGLSLAIGSFPTVQVQFDPVYQANNLYIW